MTETTAPDTTATETTETSAPDSAAGTTAPDLRAQLFAAQDWYADVVAGVDPARLHDRTPCEDYDVRQVMTHMISVLDKIIGFATDHRDLYADHSRTADQLLETMEAAARDRIDGSTPQQWAQAVRERTERARAAWTDGVLDTPIALGWGPVLPGRVVSAIYLMEVLSHAWDLATATGQPSEAPEPLGRAGLAAARICLPEQPRGLANGLPFGEVVAAAPDAGPTEAMVNWTGRRSR